MKKLILFTFLIIFSCSNNDEVEEFTGPIRLKSITFTSNNNNVRILNFFFNADGTLKKSEQIDNSQNISYINYNYSQGKLISRTRTNGSLLETYTYENNLITSKDYYNSSSGVITSTLYYEYNNNLVSKSYSDISVPLIYTYSGNNLSSTGTEFGTSFTYEYDTKQNPYTTIYTEEYKKIQLIGSNNEVLVNSINSSTNYQENTIYIYNSIGYPTMSDTNNGDLIIDYEYEQF
ncbi:hypothetical protein [Lacinutrix algicola]|uniref:hypothetical protein n=1 Tax=Lacinutrix algicola TaxID=342954 RepID=UPI0006E3591B|nr:hypothetical protein [Lacinutrix algicola]